MESVAENKCEGPFLIEIKTSKDVAINIRTPRSTSLSLIESLTFRDKKLKIRLREEIFFTQIHMRMQLCMEFHFIC